MPSLEFLDASEVRNIVECKVYFKESSDFWSSAIVCQINPDLLICALGGLISYLSRLKVACVFCINIFVCM